METEYAPIPPELAKAANAEGEMRIGKYWIRPFAHGGYWIEAANGEGGQFRTDMVEALIHEFYTTHF